MHLPNGLLAVLLAASAGVANAAESKVRGCALIDLGTLGGRSSEAVAVNSRGQVAGNSLTTDGSRHAFTWTVQGGMVDLGILGGSYSSASGMNERGQIVGSSGTPEGGPHAFSWTARGGMIDLDPRSGDAISFASAVNDLGQVAGGAIDNVGQAHGFLWTIREGMVDLPFVAHRGLFITGFNDRGQIVGTRYGTNSALAFSWTARGGTVGLGLDGRVSEAYAVNERGQVVGASDVGSPPQYHAFLWSARDGMVDLGLISARALNNRGEIVGSTGHAYLRTAHGEMVDLGTLGGCYSSALAVNDRDQVAGISDTTDGSSHAFVWTARRGMIDLGTLGGRNSAPTAMNERGDVVGNSDTADGSSHAFLWTCPDRHRAESPTDSTPDDSSAPKDDAH